MAGISFKSDESFLEKLAVGAIGTRKVMDNLKFSGNYPIELERGSTGYKIWKSIKIKRIRVPDILCVNSGIRIESRTKTKLTVSMSHSQNDPSRGWDYGLKDDDYTAFVVCNKCGDEPIDWKAQDLVQYIKVADLREAFKLGRVKEEHRKGVEEGSEFRLTWPSAIASSDGIVSSVNTRRIQFKRISDNRTISLQLINKKGISLNPFFRKGQRIQKNTILASVMPVKMNVEATYIEDSHYLNLLHSTSMADRYTVVKALPHLDGNYDSLLRERIRDENEHIYVRLESAASLTRKGDEEGFDFIRSVLNDTYLPYRLEAIIILGEIPLQQSCEILCSVLRDNRQNNDIRAGASWALGEINLESCIPSLINAFNDLDLKIRIEAARALRKLADFYAQNIVSQFASASQDLRPGIAWALAKSDRCRFEQLLSFLDYGAESDLRHWIAYVIGNAEQSRIIQNIEVADKKGRHWIACELNREYLATSCFRFFNHSNYEKICKIYKLLLKGELRDLPIDIEDQSLQFKQMELEFK